MAQNLTTPDVLTGNTRNVEVVDVEDNWRRSQTAWNSLVTQFNALNAEVQALRQGTVPPVGPGGPTTVSASYDSPSEVLTITVNSVSARVSISNTPTTAMLSQLALPDIRSPLAEGADLVGDHTATYHVSNFSLVQSLTLSVNGTEIHTLANPTVDGAQTFTFTISQSEWDSIVASSPNILNFQISGSDTNSDSISSNTVGIDITTDRNNFFYGLSSLNNPDGVDTSTLSSETIQAGATHTFNISVGPTTAGQFIIFLYPQTQDLTTIANRDFDEGNLLDDFTVTEGVRTIDSQLFDAAVYGPVSAGGAINYSITLTEVS